MTSGFCVGCGHPTHGEGCSERDWCPCLFVKGEMPASVPRCVFRPDWQRAAIRRLFSAGPSVLLGCVPYPAVDARGRGTSGSVFVPDGEWWLITHVRLSMLEGLEGARVLLLLRDTIRQVRDARAQACELMEPRSDTSLLIEPYEAATLAGEAQFWGNSLRSEDLGRHGGYP